MDWEAGAAAAAEDRDALDKLTKPEGTVGTFAGFRYFSGACSKRFAQPGAQK
jgi:hypothetical protein